jgi:hypothetical protein
VLCMEGELTRFQLLALSEQLVLSRVDILEVPCLDSRVRTRGIEAALAMH